MSSLSRGFLGIFFQYEGFLSILHFKQDLGGTEAATDTPHIELGVCILRHDMARENKLGFAQQFAQSPNLGSATELLRGRFVSVRLE